MKLSVHRADTDAKHRLDCQAARIYVNGVETKLCVEADDEAGVARLHWLDILGNYAMVGFGKGRRLAVRTVRGDIRIVLPASAPSGPYETPSKENV